MEFWIEQASRMVSLDDNIVEEYCKYDELLEHQFVIASCIMYGEIPTEEDVSKEELSKLCNEVLLGELKLFALLPKVLLVLEKHRYQIKQAAKTGKFLEFKVED